MPRDGKEPPELQRLLKILQILMKGHQKNEAFYAYVTDQAEKKLEIFKNREKKNLRKYAFEAERKRGVQTVDIGGGKTYPVLRRILNNMFSDFEAFKVSISHFNEEIYGSLNEEGLLLGTIYDLIDEISNACVGSGYDIFGSIEEQVLRRTDLWDVKEGAELEEIEKYIQSGFPREGDGTLRFPSFLETIKDSIELSQLKTIRAEIEEFIAELEKPKKSPIELIREAARLVEKAIEKIRKLRRQGIRNLQRAEFCLRALEEKRGEVEKYKGMISVPQLSGFPQKPSDSSLEIEMVDENLQLTFKEIRERISWELDKILEAFNYLHEANEASKKEARRKVA